MYEKLQQYGIRIIVVFDGIIFTKEAKYNHSEINQKLRKAYEMIQKKQNDGSFKELIDDICQFYFTDNELIKALEDLKIEYIHAPYFAINQCKYFTEYGYTHMTLCGLEGLAYNFNHIIVDIDTENDKWVYIEAKQFLKAIGFTDPKSITSLFLFAGYNPNTHNYIPISEFKGDDGKASSFFEEIR